MTTAQLNGFGYLLAILGYFILFECQIIASQNFQQLSYANAEIGEKLIRPTHTTPIVNDPNLSTTATSAVISTISTTSRPNELFGRFLNILSRNPASTTTTTRRPQTTQITPSSSNLPHSNNHNQNNVRSRIPLPNLHHHGNGDHSPSNSQPSLRSGGTTQLNSHHNASRIPVRTSVQSSSAGNIQHEEFPPLAPPRRNRPSVSSTTTARTTTTRQTVAYQSTSTTRTPTRVLPTSRSSSSIVSNGPETDNNAGNKKPELATNAEIEELSELLYKKSSPNIFPYIMVNLQGRTKSSLINDEAPLPLLTVNETVLDSTQTLTKMRALFDNYEIDSTINEYVSPNERKEENEFIDAVLATPVMRAAMKFLQDKGLVTPDPKTHFNLLKTIWFTMYSRAPGKIGSSGFEHVFMNEIKNNSIGGLHNWVWFYHKEGQTGTMHDIDYKGYMKSELLGDKGQYLKYRFAFKNINKPVNALFIGTLPELDMALYTVCFQVHKTDCQISLGGTKLTIRTYPYRYRGKRLIGSAFPE